MFIPSSNLTVFGKWGLGDFNTTGYPLNQGFETFVGQAAQVACHNWYVPRGFGSSFRVSARPPNDAHIRRVVVFLPVYRR